jgi:CRISPR type III-B/RAMP module RAMP protein Cmr6
MSLLHNLKFRNFDSNLNAELETEKHETVLVSPFVLRKTFITRAWLDRTMIDCAMGNCRLSAKAQLRSSGFWEATAVWLMSESTESQLENRPEHVFKHFGLELHKPRLNKKNKGSAMIDFNKLDKPVKNLADRFKVSNVRNDDHDLCNFIFDNVQLNRLDDRQRRNAKALSSGKFVDLVFTPDWRMVLGMGEASVYETHLTLHHTYGFPYIPASSIKGALRHFMAEAAPDMVERVFGDNDQQSSTKKPVRGQCIFFDAFPLKSPRIELDVMTPHYPEYYSKGLPPADWQSPIPIHFLTVGHGTPFRFLIGLPNSTDASELKIKLAGLLTTALEERGLGAKTAVGYGYWKEIVKAV